MSFTLCNTVPLMVPLTLFSGFLDYSTDLTFVIPERTTINVPSTFTDRIWASTTAFIGALSNIITSNFFFKDINTSSIACDDKILAGLPANVPEDNMYTFSLKGF